MRAGYDRIGREVTLQAAKRSRLDKKPFGSRNEARDFAAHHAKRHPEREPLFPYKCTLCHRFHLTRQNRGSPTQAKPMPRRDPKPKAANNPERGVEQSVVRGSHKPEVAGSSPAAATNTAKP